MRGRSVAAAIAFVVSGSCFAQANVGELTKVGGTKMSKEDLQQLHAGGVKMKGTLRNGNPYDQQNRADGTIVGTAGTGGQFTLSGTWKIDDTGKFCNDVTASGGLRINTCNFIWKTADNRYFASTDDAAGTEVRERQFIK